MNITRLTENLTAATMLAAPARPEADPDLANELYAYGCSHVDAHH
jgi:hypothetical protein